MQLYQSRVLALIENAARAVDSVVRATSSTDFISGARVVAHVPGNRTLSTIDLDFQDRRARASLNVCVQPHQPLLGARSETIFWWTPDEEGSDEEIERMLRAWSAAVTKGLSDADSRPTC